ncbi:hypothetical protein F2P45_29665 [Massilia sp. CCM 8733]|uniref:Putative adhesin Stv domain-containing protein n=1 Tax=Massilia mucilaginosa TaxID=2609282 RepID=A0ABX0P3W9_9BURK|nr:hypothetical protein [Massilia mucilaginosa]NHZ93147.1 hypothetical protein [Massilia mucilaginosa]
MPVTTSSNDVILAGHGSYEGGADNFVMPANVDFYLLQPVGTGLTDGPVLALVGCKPIDRLVLRTSVTAVSDLQPMGMPKIFRAGERAPNLVLYDLGSLKSTVQAAIPRGASNVVMVAKDTKLQDLLKSDAVQKVIKANTAKQTGARTRVFWAACANQDSNPDAGPFVWSNANAVAHAAVAYVKSLKDTAPNYDNALKAAGAALDAAKKDPFDTAAAVKAAKVFDAATAAVLKAL